MTHKKREDIIMRGLQWAVAVWMRL